MDSDRKIDMSEGVPLNSPGAANIFLNTGKNTKVNSSEGTVIHLNTEKPSNPGVHINTTFSIASSKKIKLLFVLNFLLSVICMVLSCSIAFYYWNEIISMRSQLDMISDHFILHNGNQDRGVQSALVARPRSPDAKEPRAMSFDDDELQQYARKYYVEDLGEDMLLVDSKKKNASRDNAPINDLTILKKELVVAQFNGALRELNMGTEFIMGPWVRDEEVSSRNSEDKVELVSKNTYVTIKESGLYLIYAQVVYLTQSPNCYFIWARQNDKEPRLLSTCATGDDSSQRPLNKSQMSCSVQTVARLYKGDSVNIAQREPNRTVWLRPGYSYFGFVKLSS